MKQPTVVSVNEGIQELRGLMRTLKIKHEQYLLHGSDISPITSLVLDKKGPKGSIAEVMVLLQSMIGDYDAMMEEQGDDKQKEE